VKLALRALAAWLALALAAATLAKEPRRVVAIGDVHGGYAQLAALLAGAGITDAAGRWSARDTTLVQLGDLLDRGPGERDVLDLMMRLQKEAKRRGGEVVVLLGNHEAMSMLGDLRYATAEGDASFGGAEERRRALAPKGKYGRWLRKLPAIAEIDGTVFVHGGTSPEVAALGVDGIRRRVRDELKRMDAARAGALRAGQVMPNASLDALLALQLPAIEGYPGWLISHEQGPLWFRGLAQWSDAELAQKLSGILAALRAKRIVVGHTVQLPARIRARAGARVLLVDTGLLGPPQYPGGAPLALELRGDSLTAIGVSSERTAITP
jgi:hypothetical protein